MLLRKGEVWIITGRKRRLSVKLLEDVDPDFTMFFDAELVVGKPLWASHQHETAEIGDTLTFRTTLTTFVSRSDD